MNKFKNNLYKKLGIKPIFFLLFLLFLPFFSEAQFYNGSWLTFGKNRVQYDNRLWFYYRFDNFDTYFYQEGKLIAEYTARYAKIQIKEMQQKLDYDLEDKIQFIIFNKLSDLKQSNIGLLSDEHYNIGGITYIIGTKVFLYFDGSYPSLENQIRMGLAHIVLNQTLYGNQISSNIKNSALLTLPDWYTKGLISYLAMDWNPEIDNIVKDGIVSGRYKKFNSLAESDATYAGHAIWKFIADKYGEQAIPNIIFMTKISKNVESGFLFVVGTSFKTLLKEWYDYYQQYYSNEITRNTSEGLQIRKKIKKKAVYSQLKINPDGQRVAYAINESGKYKVLVYDLQQKKAKLMMKAGNRLEEKVDYSYPLISWHPGGQLLSFVIESKGRILFFRYSFENRKMDKRELFNVNKILDYSFDESGQWLVMSAVQNGQSDIWLYSIASNTYQRVTKDIYDDMNPRFINNSLEIAFSSNRVNDTIVFDIETHMESARDTIMARPFKDIFIYNVMTKNSVLTRLTNTAEFDENFPQEFQKSYISYLSNENGISNRYVARFDSTISYIDTSTHYRYFSHTFPQTDYTSGIIEQDISPKANLLGEIIYTNGYYKMLLSNLTSVSSLLEKKLELSWYFKQKAEKKAQIAKDTVTAFQEVPKPATKKRRLISVFEGDNVEDNKVDINNYTFGTETEGKNDTILVKKNEKSSDKLSGKFIIPRQRNYQVEYSVSQMVNQIDFNSLSTTYQPFTGGGTPIFINAGLNALFMIGVMDLLEDYRITGGVRLSVDLQNNEYLLSFDNLSKRLDKQWVFHRKVYEDLQEFSIIKTYTHELHYILKYPFDNVFSLRGTGTVRNDKQVFLATDLGNLKIQNSDNYWGGIKTELVYDNTRNLGLNLYDGNRFKIFAEYFRLFSEDKKELMVLGMDFRYYQKIHKSFIWANRLAASSSFGNSKLIYYMGGVDNWLLPKFDTEINIDRDQNYAYQTLATNMRGFKQNIRNGNSFAVINSELRFPVFKYLINRPIKSEFLNNFQVIGFGDIGTAWTGPSPYSEENSLYTQIFEQYPIKITVKTQRDPVVAGYGFGLRSKVLGYFLRADWAWGVEDRVIKPSIFYISLSLDF